MRIDFARLRDKGWHVEADGNGVTLYGQNQFDPGDLPTRLAGLGLTDKQVDSVVEDVCSAAQRHQLFNDLA